MTPRLLALAAAISLALAAASLALGYEPVYDAWAWLVWGRDLAGLGLDTSSGPSWKPLTVALAVPLSLAGDLAPELWLVLVRAAWLLALVLAADLAWELAGERAPRGARIAGAAFAAASLALLADPITSWTRQGAGGMSEPPLVALVLGAVRAGLAGRTRLALVLGALAALVRPEVWPLLTLYGAWRWRAEPGRRPLLAAIAVSVPALWFGPDLLAGAGAVGGAERAQRGGGGVGDVLLRALALPLFAAWPLALAALAGRSRPAGADAPYEIVARSSAGPLANAAPRADAPRESAGPCAGRDRRLLVLAAGVLACILTVAAMAAIGFPGLPRFMAPAAAVAGALGGAGLARLLAAPAPRRPLALAVVLAAFALTAPGLPDRLSELPHAVNSTADIGASHDRLRALAAAIGPDELQRCGRLATSDVLVRTALAWQLHVPLADVISFGAPPRLSGAFVLGPQAAPGLERATAARGRLLGRRGEWSVYSVACPGSAAASADATTTGVAGARR